MNRFLYFLLFLVSLQTFSQDKNIVVLELFTSQGCSSCPPADRVLAEIKNTMSDKTVIPISYHVDYWDYIGWKDPFASKKFTEKQYEYGDKFLLRSVYTPQLIINGDEHFVGSNRSKIHKKINQYLHKKPSSNSITIDDVSINNKKVNFSYKIEGKTKNKTVHFLLVLNEKTTQVKRGENRNRTLKNSNIVVLEKVEAIKSSTGNYNLTIPDIVSKNDSLRLVALIKDKDWYVKTGTQITL
ncbi:DUF1223 domain-containing protein [Tenacibaculum sp. M341]|uniref:DUF1223 domain-containing protein n=1 Tax=Tenacibaculum sp. M341 TaxID=2530339 RepID=UPI001043D9C4|nr:DUF1223 domain-containing protein [Tenacibaculum sp. M341]TCI90321.1 DUF1223 domain-containing protein [Tenacibaculum sp. M341]